MNPENKKTIISCNDLCKSFNQGNKEQLILKDVTLTIESGNSYALVGESGSGKSTLLNILGTLDKFTSGELEILDKDLLKLSDREKTRMRLRNIGFIYQYHHLLSDYSALENVMMPLLLDGKSKNQAKGKAQTLLEKVNLADKIENRPSELSGGQQQRVAIARALANDPKIILADEPTGNLDSDNSDNVINFLIEITKSNDSSLVIATHNKEIKSLCDKVITINDGIVSTN